MCVVGEYVGKELQGDVATEFEIFRLRRLHNFPNAFISGNECSLQVCVSEGMPKLLIVVFRMAPSRYNSWHFRATTCV